MPNHSHSEIIGHAGRDAETRYLPNGDAVTEVSVAVTRKRKDKETVTWWKVVVFGKPAEWAGKIAKGDVVHASGEPVLEEWTDQNGGKRNTLKLYANSITGFGKWQKSADRQDDAPRDNAQYSHSPAPAAPAQPTGGFGDMDDDIPFQQPFHGGLWRSV